MRNLVFITLLGGASLACHDGATPVDATAFSEADDDAHLDLRVERASLISAANALSNAIAQQGVGPALGVALAEDALFLSPRTPGLEGRAAALSFLSTNPVAPSAISWQVIVADVSNDGTQGFTWSQGAITINLGGGPTERPALFLTYWRRTAGDWKVAALSLNAGGPQSTPIPDAFGTPTNKHRRTFPNTEVNEQRAQLLSVDADFSAASVSGGTGPAFASFAAPNAIAVGGGQMIFGPSDIGAMHPIPSEPSGDVRQPRLRDLIGVGRLFLYAFLFWTALALVFAVEYALLLARNDVTQPFYRLVAGQLASWWPCVLLTPPTVAATLRIRARQSSLLGALGTHVIGALLFLTVGGAMMGSLESLLPWAKPEGGLLAAAAWGVVRYIGPDLLLYLLIVAATLSAANAWESRRRAIAAATYTRQLAEARLHVLSAQLQPHFLFNTLHAISALVWEDPARADRLLARLSEMLRITLRSGARVETTLTEEVALLQRYAEIQETRYGDRLRVRFEVEAGVGDALVPRLILQPLVENAIRHGITRRITPGLVEVRAWRGGGRLHLTVRDDGVGLRSDVPVRQGVGLSITRARLRQLYGAEQRFALAPAPEGGAVCTLSFPLRLADTAT